VRRFLSLGLAGVTLMVLQGACGGTKSTQTGPSNPAVAATPSVTATIPTAATPSPTGSLNSSGGEVVPDACTLLSQATAAQISGDSTMGVYQDTRVSPTNTICAYATPEGGPGCATEPNPCGYVDLNLLATSEPVSSSEFQADRQGNFPSGFKIQTVTGIGDQAVLGLTGHEVGIIFTRGKVSVVLVAASAGRTGSEMESDIEDAARTIAALV